MTYYNANVGATGANQPLSFNPQALASSNGSATFNFPAVPNGQTWTGTVTVIGAPDSATMTISSVHVGNDIGQFIGGNNWGPLQLQSGDQLIVTATGLTANTSYVCNFQGTGITGGDPGITYPEAYAHTVTVRSQTTQLANSASAMSASGTTSLTVKVPVNPNYRSLYVIVATVGTQISVNPTNFLWQVSATTDTAQGINGYPTPYGFGSSISTAPPIGSRLITSNLAMYRFPIVSGMANNFVTFTISATYSNTPTTSIEYVIGADVENTDVAVFPTSQIINSEIWTAGSGTPIIGTNYGGFPIENTYYLSGTSWVVDPLQIAFSNTSGTPLFVETVSGSTTAVTNTSSTPLYVTGIAGGTTLPVSDQGGLSEVISTNAISGTAQTLLAAPSSGFAYRVHSIGFVPTATSATGWAWFSTSGSNGEIGSIAFSAQNGVVSAVPLFCNGLLVTTAITVAGNPSTTGPKAWIKYDLVTLPTIG